MSKHQNEQIQKPSPYFSFGFTGRIGRLEFANRFTTYLVLAVSIYLIYFYAIEDGLFTLTETYDKSIDMTKTLVRIIFHAGFITAVILLNLRAVIMRLHDISLSGWWSCLIFFLPYAIEFIIINIPMTMNQTLYYTLFLILFSIAQLIRIFPFVMPGSKILNSYGPPTKQGKPFGLILLIILASTGSYFIYQSITLQSVSIAFISNL